MNHGFFDRKTEIKYLILHMALDNIIVGFSKKNEKGGL